MSIGAAAFVAFQPGHLNDLWLVRSWLEHAATGENPYTSFGSLDYPPNALLLLLPLSWFSNAVMPFVLLPALVAATAAATWILSGWLARQCGVTLTARDRAVLVALMLAGSAFRSSMWTGQTAPFAFLFGALALRWAGPRPWLGALALACCAFKPHVALGFALAILVTAGAPVLIYAGLMVVAISALWSAAMNLPVALTWQAYFDNLLHLYSGEDRVRGLLSLRWVIEDVLAAYDLATWTYLGISAVTVVVLLGSALSTMDLRLRARIAAALMLWTLLFLPHQLYHGWMAAPALWLMMWPEGGIFRSERLRLWVVGAFVTFGVLDVPRMLRILVDPDANWTIGWFSYALSPLRLILLFALFLLVIARQQQVQQPGPPGAHA